VVGGAGGSSSRQAPRLAQPPALIFHSFSADWAYTLILGTLSLICSLFERDGRMQHNLARFWSWLIMKTILSPVKVIGMDMDKIDNSKPRVYAVTHASALDIPILYVHLPFQFRIIFKSELLGYPFIGWHLKRSGQVCINQQNPAASIGAIKSALRSLRSGMPLVIFPEGGRTRDGKIQPFLPGAFFLAIKAQAESCRSRSSAPSTCCR
jgi:1-acyl-sn-glycerol-3-phosphate acyltransferase